MYNITNASNISFTTVYNAESDFTIYCKIYNGSLNIFSNTVKYHSTNMCRVASCRQIHIAYNICTMISWMLIHIHIFLIKDDKRYNLLI